MTKKREWPDDPVVREVREARARLWQEAGGTFEGLQRLVADRAAQVKRSKPKKQKRRAKARNRD